MKQPVVAIFDIGKTNKKLLLFSEELKLISEKEEKFETVTDEDGFECDDIVKIESWINEAVRQLATSPDFDLLAVNFTTYGATLVYVDGNGKRLTPVYNYLKQIDSAVPEKIYKEYGGREEFSRCTASPPLGMLNSGMQALWLKRRNPELFSKVKHILHFPQYLSYIIGGEKSSELTSIGCHTAIWDFDKGEYHRWVKDEDLPFPEPSPVTKLVYSKIGSTKFAVGTGLHDSSASLAPYFASGPGDFILVSTGTWCINMNPFNSDKLTSEELANDCLCYLSTEGRPVKSSRLFLGHLHDSAVKKISWNFKIHEESIRLVKPDLRIFSKLQAKNPDEKIFTGELASSGEITAEPEFFVFDNFLEAYHKLMIELTDLAIDAIRLVIPENDKAERIYITGGFSRNPLFLKLLASSFPDKQVYTSEISNATALGAAIVTFKALFPEKDISPSLGLTEIRL
jgi:sugar (pentulose or hexulose) kinase